MRSLSNEHNSFILDAPDYTDSKLLAASVAEAFTVPTDANYVNFSSSGDFYVNYSTTATVPGDIADGTASEYKPTLRRVTGVATISIISASTPIVTASFYK
jgi:hypothetical protein